VVHQSNVAPVFDPAVSGALTTLSATFSYKVISGPGLGIGLMARQGNNYFLAGYIVANVGGWTTLSTGALTAASFARLSGTGTLNFSATGAPIEFGYFTANSSGGTTLQTVKFGVANFSVTVNGTAYTDANMKNNDWTSTLLTSDDLGNAKASASSTINVGDYPVTVTLAPPSPTAGVAITNQTVATFTDGDPNAQAGDFQAYIKWGDGFISDAQSSDSTIVKNLDGSFSVKGSHTYLTSATGLSFSVQVIDVAFAGAPATQTQKLSGGPGNSAYQQGTQTYTSLVRVAHIFQGAGYYNPAVSGALTSLSESFQFQVFSSASVGVGFLLRQGNSYFAYAGYQSVDPGSGWVTLSSGELTTSIWKLAAGSQAAPDFSASGAPIQFGYFTANSSVGSAIQTQTFGIANLSLSVNSNTYTDTLFSNSNWVEALLAYDSLGNPSDTKTGLINVN
jgi:hypothetical protein